MELFEYLKEEDQIIEDKLNDLIKNFQAKTREEIFDSVKVLCDLIRAIVDKKSTLVTAKLSNIGVEAPLKEEAINDRQTLLEEIESLVMVHVDEPGFDDLLKNLHKRYHSHRNFWFGMEKKLPTILSPNKRSELEANFKSFSHAITGFNTLPLEPGKTPDAIEKERKVKVNTS
jgi:hypothetical protein